jgi:ABC-type sugar transport system ATPase subunit
MAAISVTRDSQRTRPASSAWPTDMALRVIDVAKAFGPTQALRSASLELRAGEVHALVGENGSGKSTLVKMLAGVHVPDRGALEVGGRRLNGLGSPRRASEAGIATVFQEVLVVEARSVLENVWLGTEGLFRSRKPEAARRRLAQEILEALLGAPPPLDTAVESLSLSDRQACSIARALVREPRVLVLDEATSALDVATRDRLFDLLRDRAASGASVIFISHRMDEVEELGDRITVMRSGETVATLERGQASLGALVALMTGAEELTEHVRPDSAERRAGGGVVMRARHVVLADGRAPINFELRAGELVGLAGLEGHGQDAFLRALGGAGAAGGGQILREDAMIRSPRQAADAGVVYVARERRAESIFESRSIVENFALPTLGRDSTAGLLSWRRIAERFTAYRDQLGIQLADPHDRITTLSGGNQQKVVLARWLATDPRVLLLNDPSRGIDLGAKRDLYRLLLSLAESGVAVVMLSTEVDEHIELMDRVLVFRDQELFLDLTRDKLDRESLVAAFFGRIAGQP